MNNFYADIGYQSVNKHGEELCGDHVDVVEVDDETSVVVLADGLGSGVKASILSTLTAKIISTMMAENMSIQECVATIAATLPICKERHVAYATFTIMKITNDEVEIIQYDNPKIILIRNGKNEELLTTCQVIEGKEIYSSYTTLQENDVFISMSDGALHASTGMTLNLDWDRKDIIEYMEVFSEVGFTAKTLTKLLLDHTVELYGGEPGDDTTICTVRIVKRQVVNIAFGPPENKSDNERMFSLFFSKEGKHLVCGGTTSSIVANYLNKPLIPNNEILDAEIPPISSIEGVDLVTEGVVTINKVLEYAKDYNDQNLLYTTWFYQKDGASLISQLLFEHATDIYFFVGKAINPAHQNPNLPISFNIKMDLVEALSLNLKKMGKRVIVNYF